MLIWKKRKKWVKSCQVYWFSMLCGKWKWHMIICNTKHRHLWDMVAYHLIFFLLRDKQIIVHDSQRLNMSTSYSCGIRLPDMPLLLFSCIIWLQPRSSTLSQSLSIIHISFILQWLFSERLTWREMLRVGTIYVPSPQTPNNFPFDYYC